MLLGSERSTGLLAQELVLDRRLVQGADEGFDVGLELGDLPRVGSP
ncbi:hypothetical protein [Streptomyces sp. NPDC001970]